MPPWRYLAYRCDIEPAGPKFRHWVTDDESVRDALAVAEIGEPFIGRAADAIGGVHGDEPGLVEILQALTAVYSRQRLEPAAVGRVLRLFARRGRLDTRSARALFAVDPDALDHVYGTDHAARIDRDLNLPDGTSAKVIRQLDLLLKIDDRVHALVKRVDAQWPPPLILRGSVRG
jgi:hypothetical protein